MATSRSYVGNARISLLGKLSNSLLRIISSFFAILSVHVAALAETKLVAPIASPDISTSEKELPPDLTSVGLEQLLNFDLVVTTPSRKEQRLTDVASAVTVITQEDIRRSGVTHVAEALRLVPGVNVARVSSNRWAISIRGFNQMFANKLLVMIDGVSVFSPTTNGVYWEANELVLEDIDRIEVVRGPGGALWGSNAVNGVINIVTKSAKKTLGTMASGGGGSHERTFGSLRYGGSLEKDTDFRVYGTYHDRGDNRLVDPVIQSDSSENDAGQDSWQSRAGGFRLDSSPTKRDSLTLSGDFQYQTDKLFPVVPALDPPYVDSKSLAGNSSWRGVRFASNWTRQLSETSSMTTRFNYSRKERESDLVAFDYDVANAEFEHRFSPFLNHDVVYGFGYRYFYNSSRGSASNVVEPENRGFNLGSGFVQDEITLIPDTLRLTLGNKFEYNELTALELMPSVRLLYTISPSVTTWAAVSKAVASPALFFEDSIIPVQTIPDVGGGLPGMVSIFGNRGLESESLISSEIGLRAKVTQKASVDFALFYNDYSDLISVSPRPEQAAVSLSRGRPVLEIPLYFGNSLSAHSYGGEVASEIELTEDWKLVLSHSYLAVHVDLGDSLATGDKGLYEGGSPRNQSMLRSLFKLSDSTELDASIRHVGDLGYGDVPGYAELDVRFGWKPYKNVEVSLVGQNLLDSAHQEFKPNLFGLPAIEIERCFYGKVTLLF